jgi:DNA-binding YbaB/EbfC family protein
MSKDMNKIFKQVQKMQAEMERIQAELAEKTVEGTAGGGMVKVTANGKQEILEVKIDKEVVDPEDVEMLEDLIVAAVNQALENAQKMQAEGMSQLTGGMQLPGLNM